MSSKTQTTALDQINNDLKAFLDFCRENNLTDQEVAKICQPLTASIKRATLKRYLRFAAAFLLFATTIYYLTYFDSIAWHLSAIGRIILIDLLPYWNWKPLKNERCLISNFASANLESSGPIFDCALCESIDKIYVEPLIEPSFLKEHYIELHNPVILPDALQNWPIYHNPNLTLLNDRAILDSIPCKLSTNIHNGLGTVGRILSKIINFNEYFLHFQNCDFDATKTFRIVSPRPSFLPAEVSPVQYSWLLMSRNYNVSNFKAIELKEPITVIGQVSGCNFFRLIARHNCELECPVLNIELMRGEALVFTSMWDLEYRPTVPGENIAVILEMH